MWPRGLCSGRGCAAGGCCSRARRMRCSWVRRARSEVLEKSLSWKDGSRGRMEMSHQHHIGPSAEACRGERGRAPRQEPPGGEVHGLRAALLMGNICSEQ